MKKSAATILALVLALSVMAASAEGTSDKQYVLDKGVLVVGITDFAPMDYKDENGDWDNKILELDAKAVDCIWNGMTLTDAVLNAMECSNPYMNNAQVVVVSADKAEQYQTVESLAGLTFAVEAGSAGEAEVNALGLNCTPVTAQADALMEVAAGTSDAAVIDALMAAAMIGEGTSYANLTYTVGLNSEEYGVGFRKGSDLAAELNAFLVQYAADGELAKVAETYKVQAALIEQK